MPASESTPLLVGEPNTRLRFITRYAIHLLHTLIGILFLVLIILTAIFNNEFLFIFYLIPIMLSIFIIELPFLFRRPPNERLAKKYGMFYNKLTVRGYVYQLGAAVGIAAGSRICPAAGITAWILWVEGFFMVLVAVTAKHCERLEWLEEDDPQDHIQLPA